MADDVGQGREPYGPVRVRRPELVRPADDRRDFTIREAQRRLQEKERPRWALIAYAVFLVALVVIFAVTYTTYAFSKYRDVILPGVHVSTISLEGMTTAQARTALANQLYTQSFVPVRLLYGSLPPWKPTPQDIGYDPKVNDTVAAAQLVGRHETLPEQLLDRLPVHPSHSVALVYTLDNRKLMAYIQSPVVAGRLHAATVNASLKVDPKTNRVLLVPSRPGRSLDVAGANAAIQSALGALSTQDVTLPVNQATPAITDSYARGIRDKVEQFLANPPVIAVGKRVFVTTRATFAPMFHFQDQVGKREASIKMTVDSTAVSQYVTTLASEFDRPAANARFQFAGGTIQVIQQRRLGRTLDQQDALSQLIPVISGLKPHARLHFKVTTIQPPQDLHNPASLGINRLLAVGTTSFQGAGPTRSGDITTIAKSLNEDLLPPNQDVSFNSLAGTNWESRVFVDHERQVNGQLVPAGSGAMQQVATTFLRALYSAGLKLLERHSHPYRLPWYEPPVGEDAVVSPVNGGDLRFANNTGKYLLVETHVEPVQQSISIYVYGPALGWKVQVDPLGKVTKVYPHGPTIIRQDPSLSPDQVQQTAWAHDGADTIVQRTITFPNGNVRTDTIASHYQAWRGIKMVGSIPPTPKPSKSTPTPTPSVSPTAAASPTPTFNH